LRSAFSFSLALLCSLFRALKAVCCSSDKFAILFDCRSLKLLVLNLANPFLLPLMDEDWYLPSDDGVDPTFLPGTFAFAHCPSWQTAFLHWCFLSL
jgi:hypothetical protein